MNKRIPNNIRHPKTKMVVTLEDGYLPTELLLDMANSDTCAERSKDVHSGLCISTAEYVSYNKSKLTSSVLNSEGIQDNDTTSEKCCTIHITEPLVNLSFTKECNSEPHSLFNGAHFTKILELSTGKSWALDQNKIVLRRANDMDMLSWLIDPDNNIFMLGFKGKDENDVSYVTTVTSGLLSVTKNGVHPSKLEKSVIHADRRSLRIYKSLRTGKGHIQSTWNKDLWVGADSEGNVIVMKTSERYAKPWSWTL